MSGKDFLNRHVLSWRRKVYSDWEDVTSSGRAFQVFRPATESLEYFTRTNNKTIIKGPVYLLMELHITATECHLPYGITQCYLPPDTSEHTAL